MLQRFLFIGLGGSGGKTLRILRRELQNRLREVDYPGGIPRGWQFLQIDVPAVPDGNEPELPPQLPAGSYVGLAGPNLSYQDFDSILISRGDRVLEHSVGWRPDPHKVMIAPAFGAGQYRAVGRTVVASGMQQVVDHLNRAITALSHIDSESELDAVSQAFGNPPTTQSVEPMAVVVSSLAGGAGAGVLLDVCDVLRMISTDKWVDRSVGVLFTPDVFSELNPTNRSGVQANALAVISELMAGYWNSVSPDSTEFALLESAGVAVSGQIDRRGPAYPLLVGKSNGQVSFGRQNDVYRAVGRSLAAWVTSAHVQGDIRAYFMGNWLSSGGNVPDRLGLNLPVEATPFASFGYASVSLGRERFARYAAERLARAAVEQLLRGHWTDEVPEKETPEAACDRAAEGHGIAFLEKSGLRELGPDHNQILDALRGGEIHQARVANLRELHRTIAAAVKQGRTEFTAEEAIRAINTQLQGRWTEFLHQQLSHDEERAKQWVEDIQGRILQTTAGKLGKAGAPVTIKLLDNAMDELSNAVGPELHQDAASKRHLVGTTQARISSVFAGFTGKLTPDNPLLDKAVKEGTDSLWAETEASLYELTAGLIGDLVEHFLRPLRTAVDRARSALTTEEVGSVSVPSPVDQWPQREVPERLRPTENEILLDDSATYPAVFDEQVRATLGTADVGGAFIQAVQQVITGSRSETEEQTVIRRTTAWVPQDRVLRTTTGARSASFEVRLGCKELLERATQWVNERDTAIGAHVHETLASYLEPSDVDPAVHRERLERFRSSFRTALTTSHPFIHVDEAALLAVHERKEPGYNRILSVLPFPGSHPAREVATEILLEQGVERRAIDRLFDDGTQSRIEISTFLAAPYQPVVYTSVMGPIAAEWAAKKDQGDLGGFWRWRRARPLRNFVPASPDVRLNMIRGWFTARLLGQLQSDDPQGRATTIFVPGEGWKAFPFPVLGPPVVKLRDLLPALLESLPIALVERSSRGPEALAPYLRLEGLGRPPHGDVDYASLHPELQTWVNKGTVGPGAPMPSEGDAGSASSDSKARLEAVHTFLDRFLKAYEQLDGESVTAKSVLRLSRAWEMRADLILALEQLLVMCQRDMAATEDEPVG